MAYYWKLTYGSYDDLKTIFIPPEPKNMEGLTPIQVVQRRWDSGQPIHTSNGSIAASMVREFVPTDKPYSDQALLEAGAKAFKEAIVTDMGSIKTRSGVEVKYEGIAGKWVKQVTTQQQWERYYSRIDSYHKLYNESGMVTMAFRKATHDIDVMLTPECTDKEVELLTKDR
jgi:hypothetical protein